MSTELIVHSARYFTSAKSLDVTARVREMIASDGLSFAATNAAFQGDPHYGTPKQLFIDYTFDNKRVQVTVKEDEWVSIGDLPSTNSNNTTEFANTFTDIIIPSYNNAEITANCFRSIKRCTKAGTFRVIWVDNGSADMTAAARELDGVNRICVYLPSNLGFVGAVNEGLRLSDAPSVCFLNNDTVVTPRWLEKLNNTLYGNAQLGIIGPMTAYAPIGKEDSPHNLNLHTSLLPDEARQWPVDRLSAELELRYSGKFHFTDFVAFLCAVIKREVINKVGALDSSFAMGMWDDVDYNRSAIVNGYKVVLAMDTCIYHRGRSTFNVVEKSERLDVNALLTRNRAYLDEKWKDHAAFLWTPRSKVEVSK